MKLKFEIEQFVISLVISPVVFYIVDGIAKLFQKSYRISHGELFII